eukprot:TRINITY_DN15118_c0_g1_i1.p1 TRINITY_DN15118_c0_g1~~TRINITY_DN15118_c0_g1_i1.p1  ORF type:complete len:108 (+),score=4.62 TRINITY_DN15118_c0_g1_i1:51-374(+)
MCLASRGPGTMIALLRGELRSCIISLMLSKQKAAPLVTQRLGACSTCVNLSCLGVYVFHIFCVCGYTLLSGLSHVFGIVWTRDYDCFSFAWRAQKLHHQSDAFQTIG